jgi:hypothetical protein
VLLIALVPDWIRSATRRRGVTLDLEGLRYVGLSVTASVRWEDITVVTPNVYTSMLHAIAVHTRPGAQSLKWKRRWILIPLEKKAVPGVIVVQMESTRAAAGLRDIVAELAAADPLRRRDILGSPVTSAHLLPDGDGS